MNRCRICAAPTTGGADWCRDCLEWRRIARRLAAYQAGLNDAPRSIPSKLAQPRPVEDAA